MPLEEDPKHHFSQIRGKTVQNLGMGSILTFGNPKDRSLVYFAYKALDEKELWALRASYITVFYYDVPRTFREAVAYDRRFHLSWSEVERDHTYFTAHSSIYHWWKFLKHKDDSSFREEHRDLMSTTWDLFQKALPELFNE